MVCALASPRVALVREPDSVNYIETESQHLSRSLTPQFRRMQDTQTPSNPGPSQQTTVQFQYIHIVKIKARNISVELVGEIS